MNGQPANMPTPDSSRGERFARRGVVIVAVLLVVTLLALAGYQYADMMTAEAGVAENAHRAAQAKAFAESGIWYTAALLANANTVNPGMLNAYPYMNNPTLFQGQQFQGDNGLTGRFTILGPFDPNTMMVTQPTFCVEDETAKINLVAWMQNDTTGQNLYNMLLNLPNMQPQIAANIVAWMGGSYGINQGGAQDSYYQSLTPPYRCKNTVPDSLDELLLVQGVTRDLLYGADTNRNGYQDGNEQTVTSSTILPQSGFDRGWSAYLTVYSREQNCDPYGNPLMWINNPDLQQLYNAISVDIDDNLAKFILLYRMYGGTPIQKSTLGAVAALAGGSSGSGTQGNLSQYVVQYGQPSTNGNITSFFQLVNSQVKNVPGKDSSGKSTTLTYTSPLYNNLSYQRQVLPMLFQYCTLYNPQQYPELPARINVNTAQYETLLGLTVLGTGGTTSGSGASSSGTSSSSTSGSGTSGSGSGSNSGSNSNSSNSSGSSSGTGSSGTGYNGVYQPPTAGIVTKATGLQETDVANILQLRQQMTGMGIMGGDIYATPTWLLTEAGISATTLANLEPLITTRSQVYRVQSVGYFDGGKGPYYRVEAMVDTNAGRPRVLAWRNLSDLGKGYVDPTAAGGGSSSGPGSGANSNP